MLLNYEATKAHYFGEKARTYDQGREDSEKWKNEFEAVRASLATRTGSVLDIPCGTGRFFEIYEGLGLEYAGMDVSEEMMAQARAKADDPELVVHGDIMKIPMDDSSVDYTVCIRLLNFLQLHEMQDAVRELCRVTSDLVICGAFTAPEAEQRNRCNVFAYVDFVRAFEFCGWRVMGGYEIRKPDYTVYHCAPA